MCGIAGIIGKVHCKTIVPAMIDKMNHRGPDARGFFVADGVHLGHCRLAINDLSVAANQPFCSEDKKVAIIVNGEIYNFKELQEELQAKGCHFHSASDSEVLLHGYLRHGIDFVDCLNGMFAFAIWDGRDQTLYLGRDRLGIKPLYYSHSRKSLAFASEIKALVQYESIDLSVDYQSLIEYLAFENYFSNRTLNASIKQIEPGEILTFTSCNNQLVRKYFWQPHISEEPVCLIDIYEEYSAKVKQSVQRHLLSDVPLGAYLSSGIDSSSVAYLSRQLLGRSFPTYTGSFGMSGFYDESDDAIKIAKLLGCTNKNIQISSDDFIQNIESIVWHLDEPRMGMGSFSQYMVAKQASKEVKVILTGHGGDEFFAGYPVFKAVLGRSNPFKLLANSSRRELLYSFYFSVMPLLKKELRYFLPNIFSGNSLDKLLLNRKVSKNNLLFKLDQIKEKCDNSYQQLILTYLRYYLPALFVVEDKISMAFSLESRTPLCDNAMLDLALSIPLAQKLKGFELKHIPRRAMRGKLPDFIYSLPKKGFPTPLLFWFRKELRHYIKSYILDNIAYLHMFDPKYVEKLITSFQKTKIVTPFTDLAAHKLWMMLNLIIYFKNQKNRYR